MQWDHPVCNHQRRARPTVLKRDCNFSGQRTSKLDESSVRLVAEFNVASIHQKNNTAGARERLSIYMDIEITYAFAWNSAATDIAIARLVNA